MSLPASLIRGEVLSLQIAVHNYLDVDLRDVTVSLINVTDFKKVTVVKNVRSYEELKGANAVIRIPLIRAQSGESITFQITPVNIGLLTLTARGLSAVAGDTEKKTIRVKPEGVEKSETTSLLVDMRTNNTLKRDFDVSFPSTIIPDSEFCKVHLIGDFIGVSLNNLDKLIKIPSGCGEQNMIGLTPNIYALRYLLSTSESSSGVSNREELIKKAKKNIEIGYKRELEYKHKDGSYSAWGESDASGSSWLTAFVLKSFAQAKEFVDVIDDEVLEKAISFLIKNQRSDGSFAEPGAVIDFKIQGGGHSKQTVTASIAIALLESKFTDERANRSLSNAISYLESSLSELQNDRYALTVVTYALHLAQSHLADKAFGILKRQATLTDDGNLFWSTSSKLNDFHDSDIELTSYALLIYLQRNKIVEALPIVKWLLGSHFTSLGGFSNSQNTVLGIQALSEYSTRLTMNSLDQSDSISFSVKLGQQIKGSTRAVDRSFVTNERNKLVLQIWELPSCRFSPLSLSANGSGLAMFQFIKIYNLPYKTKSTAFTIKQTAVEYGKRSLQMHTCLTYNEVDQETGEHLETGMVMIEAYLLSGYEIDQNELDAMVVSKTYPKLKMAELSKEKDKISFYLSKMDSETVCIDWKMVNVFSVENLQPVEVKAYDYYKPKVEVSMMFGAPKFAL
jgi:CD109 antigen